MRKWEDAIVDSLLYILKAEVSAEKKNKLLLSVQQDYDNIPLLFYTTVVYSLQHLGEKIWFVDCSGAKNLSQFLP